MTNEVTTYETRALATKANADPFLAYADAVRPEHILGKLLKHSKGEYLAGEDAEVLPLGTKMVVAMDLLTIGYVRWSGGKPAEHRMVMVADGAQPPRRVDLGDADPACWEERDASGAPRDPWQLTQYLPMIDESGELFTFSTSARGGIGAIATLARNYARSRAAHPGQFPVIELQVDAYSHSNSSYGRIKVPVFKFVGWEAKATFLKAAGMETPTPAVEDGAFEEGVPPPSDADFADQIPF
jgi:hypothetical protein